MKAIQSSQLGKVSQIQGNVLVKTHGSDTERIPELEDTIMEGDYLDLSHGSIEITLNSGENVFLPQGAQFVINENLINILLQNIGGSSDGMSSLLQEKRSSSFIQYYYTSLILLLLFGTVDILNQQISSGIDFSLTEASPSAGFETSPVLGIAAELFDKTYNQINSAINQQFAPDLSTLLDATASGGLQDTGFGFVSNDPNNLTTDVTAGVDTTNNNDDGGNQNNPEVIFDDRPRITSSTATPNSLQVDETNIANGSAFNFGSLFSLNPGANGQASVFYELVLTNSNSGIFDSVKNQPVTFSGGGSNIIGRNADGEIVLTLTIDPSTGVAILTQLRGIIHSDPNDPDDFLNINSGTIAIKVTLTDLDGDSATAQVDISPAIKFHDHAPEITQEASNLIVDDDDAQGGIGDDAPGDDTPQTTGSVNVDYGADGFGSIVFTTDNQPPNYTYTLSNNGQTLTITENNGDGELVLTIQDDGTYEVVINQSFDNLAVGNENDLTPFSVTIAATDSDGDTITSNFLIEVDDDLPVVTIIGQPENDSLQVDETDLTTDAKTDYSGLFDLNPGGDGEKSRSYELVINNAASGLVDTATGQDVTLSLNGTTIEGRNDDGDLVFSLSVNAQTGEVTLDQQRAIRHLDPNNHDEEISPTANTIGFKVTLIDNDDDPDSKEVDLSEALSFRDDGPDAQVSGAQLDTLTLDESPLPAAGDGVQTVSANFADNFAAPDYGTDGAGSTSYALLLAAADTASGLYALDNTDTSAGDGDGIGQGDEILLNISGNVITGSAGGTDYFTIEVNPSSGEVTFTQLANIWHPDSADHDDSQTLTTAAASDVQIEQTNVDADGDSASAQVNLGQNVFIIEDDGPDAQVSGAQLDTLTLDESPLPAGGDGVQTVSANFADNFAAPDYGTDGAGSTSYALLLAAANTASGLYALDNTDTSAGDGDGIGQGDEILLNISGNVITGSAGGTDYFTIEVNPSTGEVTFTQLANIWHPDNADHDDSQTLTTAAAGDVQIEQTNVDADGDSASAQVNLGQNVFIIEDDGPDAQVSGAQLDTLTLDESPLPAGGDGVQTVSANFADNFAAPDYGTDGAGSTSYALLLAAADTASGLYALDNTDTSAGDGDGIGQGDEILLNISGNVITGSAGGTDYFTIEVNPSTGEVTFTQLANIWHPDNADHDDSQTLTTAAAGDVQIEQTNVDADGDSASAQVNLGQNVFIIEDDGPDAQVSGAQLDTLTLDESPLPAAGDGVQTVSANFADNFAAPDYGTDGAGSTSYALLLATANTASGLYALDNTDTSAGDGDGIGQGDEILLNISGNVITGSAGGTDYFTIEVNPSSGEVTFTQLANIWHPDSADHDDSQTLTTAAAGDVQIEQTNVDADGDSASAQVNLGQNVFIIEDDGPDAQVSGAQLDTLTLDESPLPAGGDGVQTVSANFADNFAAPDYGTDGAGSTSYALLLAAANTASGLYALDNTDTSAGDGDGIGQGDEILLNISGNVITGSAGGTDYFTIEVNPSTGEVTFTQLANIWHPDSADHDDSQTLTTAAAGDVQIEQTNVDADGDSASAQVNLGQNVFIIEDDGPDAQVSGAQLDTLTLDESPLPAAGDGVQTVSANFADNFAAPDYGTDGAGSTSYALLLAAANTASGLYALDNTDTSAGDGDGIGQGDEILLNLSGNVITGSAGGTDYFTIEVNPSTGEVTFTQLANIWHPDSADHDDSQTLTTAAAGDVQIEQTNVDTDGDSASAQVNLGQNVFIIEDDGPDAQVSGAQLDTLTLDESPLPAAGDGVQTVSANFADNFAAPDYGTDGAGSTSYALLLTAANTASGLYALDNTDTSAGDGDGIGQGDEILLNISGNVITGSAGGTDYFTIEVNPGTGEVTFTQLANIWHPDSADHDDSQTLTTAAAGDVQIEQTNVDADGDSASAQVNLGQNVFIIEDDGPDAQVSGAQLDTLTLDESPLPAAGDGVQTVSANFADNFAAPDYGTDGAGSTSYALLLAAANTASGLYALDNTDTSAGDGDGIGQGDEILLNISGNVITGSAGGTDYFTIEVNPGTGEVTFTQLANIWHPDSADHDDSQTLTTAAAGDVQIEQTNVDADGDSASAQVNLGQNVFIIEDDGPDAQVSGAQLDTLTLDESPLPAAGDGVQTVSANFADNFAAPDYGTDGAGSTSYALLLAAANTASGLYALDNTDTSAGDGDGIGQGDEILLNISGNVITGSAGGTDYFTIEVNPGTGEVTFTQLANIWHPDSADHDDSQTLTTAAAGDVQIEQTNVDADGDSASAQVNLGQNVFIIEDDGPDAQVSGAQLDTLTLDESPLPAAGDGVQTVSANFADNFAAPDYGTDGAGSTSYALLLAAANTASGLYALDNTDTSAGDGDGIGQGDEILLNLSGNVITGSAGGTDYFTIEVNPSTGEVTFTQLANIWHPDSADHDDSQTLTTAAAGDVQIEQTNVDTDGDSASAQVNLGQNVFIIEDDGPDAQVSGAQLDTLTLDESPLPAAGDGVQTVSANFADNFAAPDYGTDGAGSTSYALLLTAANTASGLYALDNTDTSAGDGDGIGQGDEILLNLSGNVITGSAGGTDYFTIEVNPGTGEVTFTQLANIWHPDSADHDDSQTLTTAAAGDVQIEQTNVDADGDSASAQVNLGQNVFIIEDDGPDAQVSGAQLDTLTLDESPLPAAGDGVQTVSANFADNFAAPDYGTDGAGSTSYALLLAAANTASGLYALDNTDTSAGDGDGIGQGDEILLNISGNVITGSAGGTDYFTIEVNPGTGEVTFTQLANIWHPDSADHDDSQTLTTAAAGDVQIEQTNVDTDGDSASAQVNLGQNVFIIEDDGPDAQVSGAQLDTLTLDESPLPAAGDGVQTVSANFADNFAAPDYGTDGAGSTSYALLLTAANTASGLYALDNTDTSAGDGDGIGQGDEILLNISGNVITGSAGGTDYFTIEVNPGTGEVTFTQLANIWHPDSADHDDSQTLTTAAAGDVQIEQTNVDADGDSASAQVNLGQNVFIIEDDGPDAQVSGAQLDTLTLDESPLPAAGDGVQTVSANFADNFAAPDYGTDGAGSTSYALLLAAANTASGLYALDNTDTSAGDGDGIGQGDEILLNISGNVITGSAGGTDYFTIEVNPGTGEVTFTQLANIWHPDSADHDDSQTLTTAAAGDVQIEQTNVDADGDSASAQVNLGQNVFIIEDDGPDAQVSGAQLDTLTLDESPLPAAGDGVQTVSANFADNFAAPDYGTDGAGSTSYALLLAAANTASGLYALDNTDTSAGDGDGIGQGDEILLNISGNVITGSAGGTDYFTIEVNPGTGEVTFTQLANIWHPDSADHDDSQTLTTAAAGDVQIEQTNVDADGDSASAQVNLGQNVFIIEDDGPDAQVSGAQLDTLTLDESPLPAAGDGVQTVSANFADNFAAPDYGTDGAGSTSYALLLAAANTASGLYALDNTDTSAGDGDGIGQGDEILLNLSGNVITGSAGGTDYFTIEVNPSTGEVTFTQLANIWHPDSADHDDSQTLTTAAAGDVQIEQTNVDTDGDSASAQVNLGQNVFIIEDDGPDAQVSGAQLDTLTLDESPLPAAGDGVQTVSANFADNFAAPDYGTDGAGSTSYALLLTAANTASGLYALDNTDTSAGDGDGIGQGDEILLNLSGNVITGSAGGTDYFTIEVNPGTGEVTFTQLANIWHPDSADHDDSQTLTTAAAGDVQIEQTNVDADGDSASAQVNLGQNVFIIEDDGPDAQVSGAQLDTLTLDESPLPAAGDGVQTVSANFADNFAAPDYGTDGAGSTSYALLLAAANTASGLYALDNTDTSAGDGDGIGQGDEILLNISGNVITGSAGGTDYFTIEVNPGTGEVTFTQLANIWHPDSADHDDSQTLTTAAAGDVQIEQTNVDADGDSASAQVNLGQNVFIIEDDGPDAQVSGAQLDTLTLDESPLPAAGDGVQTVSANFADNFAAPDYGTDGAGSTSYALLLAAANTASGLYALDNTDTSAGDGDGIGQGDEILLNISGNVITGSAGGTDYFTIEVNPGTGEVTFTQLANIWHPDSADHDDSQTLTTAAAGDVQIEQTNVDADGDSASAQVNLGQNVFIIEDDGPDAQASGAQLDTLTLDESPLPAAGDGVQTVSANFADNFAAPDYGTDGAGSTSYALLLAAANTASGLYALDNTDTSAGDGDGIGQGDEILLNLSGNVITGSAGGTDYFTIEVNPGTGEVTFTQLANIWHPDSADHDDSQTLTTAAAGDVQIEQTNVDADGDSASAQVNLGQNVFIIEDDGPDAQVSGAQLDTLTLDESPLPAAGDGVQTVSANFADNFAAPDYGTDGAGSTSYALLLAAANTASGLYALDNTDTSAGDGDGIGQGDEILLNISGNVITGSAGGTDYFTITIDPNTGDVTFTRNATVTIWHPDSNNNDDMAILNTLTADALQVQQTIIDADGDSSSAQINLGQGVFIIEDVGPQAETECVNLDMPNILQGLFAQFYNVNSDIPNNDPLTTVENHIANNDPNGSFISTVVSYDDDASDGDLGEDNGEHLIQWLGSDASSLQFDGPPQSTDDAIIRMSGFIELQSGNNNFRIRSDDGYVVRIKINDVWQEVAIRNQNQAPTTTTFAAFVIPATGQYEMELIYWDQGGQYVLEVELQHEANGYNFIGSNSGSDLTHYGNGEESYIIAASDLLSNDTAAELNGIPLTIFEVGNAVGGTVELNVNGDVVFTPDLNFVGLPSFDYTIMDGDGDTSTVTVEVNVAPSLIIDQNGVITEDDSTPDLSITGNVAISDVDPNDVLTANVSYNNDITWSGGNLSQAQINAFTTAAFNLTNNNTEWNYTIANNLTQFMDEGETITLSYDVTVTDSKGLSTTETVNLTINGVNDAPIAVDDNDNINMLSQNSINGNVLDNDSDVDTNDSIQVANPGQQTGNYGTLDLQSDGNYTYTLFDTVDLDDDLVAFWQFDTVADEANSGSQADNIILQGGASLTNGKLVLNGSTAFANVPDSPDINLGSYSERSMSINFQANDPAGGRQFIYEEGAGVRGLNVYIEAGKLYVVGWNTPFFESNWSGNYVEFDLTDTNWHNITFVLNDSANTLTAYLDGVAKSTFGASLSPHGGNINFGASDGATRVAGTNNNAVLDTNFSTYGFFNGQIEDARIYDRALNQAEINILANQNTPLVDEFNYEAFDGTDNSNVATLTIDIATATNSIQANVANTGPVADTPQLTLNSFSLNGDSLLINGGFEQVNGTPDVTGNNWEYYSGDKIPGWNVLEDKLIEIRYDNPSEGNRFTEMDADENVTLTQTIDTTANHHYEIQFDYRPKQPSNPETNGVEIYWNDTLLDTIATGDTEWKTYIYTVEGDGNPGELKFVSIGSENFHGALIDNVSLVDLNSFKVDIEAMLNDIDGNEVLNVIMDGLPTGATVSDGVNNYNADANSLHAVDITSWDLANLNLELPNVANNETFEVEVTATAMESINGDTASNTITVATEKDVSPQLTGTNSTPNNFVFNPQTIGNDSQDEYHILDFDANSDVITLTDLLSYNENTDDINDYLSLDIDDNSGDVSISISTNGNVTTSVDETLVLEQADLTALNANINDSSAVLTAMIAAQVLVVE